MRVCLFAFLFAFIARCSDEKSVALMHTLDFGAFTIEVPQNWTKIQARGIDSYIGRIAIDSTDTLEFDLGWYSNTLREYEPLVIDTTRYGHINISDPRDSSGYVFVNKKVDEDKYRKNNIAWDTIDGRLAKVVFPIHSGLGTTGVYFDSVWGTSDVTRFNIYGQNLNPKNEQTLLKALRTIRFHRSK